MADDIEFPPELLEAQRAFYTADAVVQELVAALPSSVDVVAGEAEVPGGEQRAAVKKARAERLRLVDILYGHDWWETVEDPYATRIKLQKAARTFTPARQ